MKTLKDWYHYLLNKNLVEPKSIPLKLLLFLNFLNIVSYIDVITKNKNSNTQEALLIETQILVSLFNAKEKKILPEHLYNQLAALLGEIRAQLGGNANNKILQLKTILQVFFDAQARAMIWSTENTTIIQELATDHHLLMEQMPALLQDCQATAAKYKYKDPVTSGVLANVSFGHIDMKHLPTDAATAAANSGGSPSSAASAPPSSSPPALTITVPSPQPSPASAATAGSNGSLSSKANSSSSSSSPQHQPGVLQQAAVGALGIAGNVLGSVVHRLPTGLQARLASTKAFVNAAAQGLVTLTAAPAQSPLPSPPAATPNSGSSNTASSPQPAAPAAAAPAVAAVTVTTPSPCRP